MRYLIAVLLPRFVELIPAPLKVVAKRMRLNRVYDLLLDKYSSELAFQTRWAKAYDGKSDLLRKHLAVIWKEHRCLDKIEEICRIRDDSRVLDVGCGIASVLHILKGKKHGIDPLADEYSKIYGYPSDISVQKGFAEKIPFPNDSFDFVFCSNVLDHVTDPSVTVREICRVMKTGGQFILIVEIFRENVKRNPAHPHSLTKGDVDELIGEGFEVICEERRPWHSGAADTEGLIAILKKKQNAD